MVKGHAILLAWKKGRPETDDIVHVYPFSGVTTAASLHYGKDIHVYLTPEELKTLVNISIDETSPNKSNISNYFTQHPNQTQAVSDQYSGTSYSGHPDTVEPLIQDNLIWWNPLFRTP